jgi:hypothetical protein
MGTHGLVTYRLEAGQILHGHHPDDCTAVWCVLHHRLPQYAEWPRRWDERLRIMELICVHGVAHPAPEQFGYWFRHRQLHLTEHDPCDGCCAGFSTAGDFIDGEVVDVRRELPDAGRRAIGGGTT